MICLSRGERWMIHAMTAVAVLVVVALTAVVVSQPELPRTDPNATSGAEAPAQTR
jgi:hypothetical protein